MNAYTRVLEVYEKALGQKLNKEKTSLFSAEIRRRKRRPLFYL
jgi:hypothetical protein